MKTLRRFLLLLLALSTASLPAADASRRRVIVSTDIGGTDDDDSQSLAHLLLYADAMDLEGLISSPYGPGRKRHLLEVIDAYAEDYPTLKTHSNLYPAPDHLRSITKEGALEAVEDPGFGPSTDGSDWIIRCARRDDPRPLWVLVWGGIDDVAQALHDAPDILPKLRVYWIGGPNKKWGANGYNYIERHHPNLWIIEANSTYSGWFVGGDQTGEWGNSTFVAKHVAGHGALGRYFAKWINGSMKMGDSPSVMYVLGKNPEDPTQESWGGSFVRAWERPRVVFNRLTTAEDRVEQYAIVDIELPPGHGVTRSHRAHLAVENQMLPGFVDPQSGVLRFRFSPKAAKAWSYTIHSDMPAIDGKTGALTSVYGPPADKAQPWSRTPNWWTDNPAPELRDASQQGAKTVSRWRTEFLRDFAARMERLATPKPRN
ncbi:MAG: DUF1593 domain-containing protein [Opitutaceae bacterium]